MCFWNFNNDPRVCLLIKLNDDEEDELLKERNARNEIVFLCVNVTQFFSYFANLTNLCYRHHYLVDAQR